MDEGFNVSLSYVEGDRPRLRHGRHVVGHDVWAPELDLNAAVSELRAILRSLSTETDTTRISGIVRHDDRWIVAGLRGACADLAVNRCLQTIAAPRRGV